uniref:Uncharacterized protein n=1 Tax=Caenorhabditis japonica TaxID=281687 RepID=A0A8R1I6C8_CAEJA
MSTAASKIALFMIILSVLIVQTTGQYYGGYAYPTAGGYGYGLPSANSYYGGYGPGYGYGYGYEYASPYSGYVGKRSSGFGRRG